MLRSLLMRLVLLVLQLVLHSQFRHDVTIRSLNASHLPSALYAPLDTVNQCLDPTEERYSCQLDANGYL